MRRNKLFSKRVDGTFVCLSVLLGIFALAAAPAHAKKRPLPPPLPPQIDTTLSVPQAMDILRTVLGRVNRGNTFWCVNRQPLQNINVTKDSFSYVDSGALDRGFRGKTPYSVQVRYVFKQMPYLVVQQEPKNRGWIIANWQTVWNAEQFTPPNTVSICVGGLSFDNQDFYSFIRAFNRMVWEYSPQAAQARQQQENAFLQQANAWRALAVKPAMPEDAYVHKVLAENAYKEKNLPKAMAEYRAALNLFPTWPDGQNNLAILCGESGDYECALKHMQNYLMLVPNAPDARAALDHIIIWRDKLGLPPQP